MRMPRFGTAHRSAHVAILVARNGTLANMTRLSESCDQSQFMVRVSLTNTTQLSIAHRMTLRFEQTTRCSRRFVFVSLEGNCLPKSGDTRTLLGRKENTRTEANTVEELFALQWRASFTRVCCRSLDVKRV